ncbi:hypothetical protein PtB15_2B872 [Puccinia triticina]|nr:hypothetical protein PtB15_2B872 [Puccinia triticina]
MCLSPVNRRNSYAQGAAFLLLYSKSFGPPAGPSSGTGLERLKSRLIDSLKREIRRGNGSIHYPISFAFVTGLLGLSFDRAIHLHIFLHIRSILSAAVRLNIIGPYLSQKIMFTNMKSMLDSISGEIEGKRLARSDLVECGLLDPGQPEGNRPGKQVQLQEYEIKFLCTRAREIFINQPILLELEAPIKICGDIHGQYYDLLRLFEYGGFPPEANYLFLGDYVDRGKQSLETICLLLAYKIKYPENFFILRGNHECASINRIYGFYDECKRRYNIKLWKTFTDCFNCLPIAAIIDEKIFTMHGGLSPDLQSMEQIRRVMRPTDVPDTGLLCDLLWSDPDKDITGWSENDRGVSFTFGPDVVTRFLQKHDMDLICRAHQVVEDGYEFFAKRQLVTLFSAPNYCGEFDNAGAMMSVDETLLCSFQILKPAEKKQKFMYGGMNTGRPVTPPRKQKKKDGGKPA